MHKIVLSLIIFVLNVLPGIMAFADSSKPYTKAGPRPVEISSNEINRRSGSWRMCAQDLSQWRIASKNLADVTLTLSDEYQLWEDRVAKLSFTVPDMRNPDMEITLYPDQPFRIAHDFDMVEFWVNGPKVFHGFPELEFTATDGVRNFIPAVGGGHHWDHSSYWGTALSNRKPAGKAPWMLTAIRFRIKPESGAVDGKRQALYFDEFSFFRRDWTTLPLEWRAHYPKPTTSDTILPPVKNLHLENRVIATKDGWDFIADDAGKRLTYRYIPRSGTFGDVEIIAPNGKHFHAATGGGPEAIVDNNVIAPDDRSVTPVLLDARLEGNTLTTRWRREKAGKHFSYELKLTVKGKSLVIDVNGTEPVIAYIRPGHTENTPNLLLQPVSFWDSRYGTPVVMSANDVFTTLVMDAYSSEGSYHIEGGHNFLGVQGKPLQLDANRARLLGGTAYHPLSDGSRNPARERWFLTVSEDFGEVLPRIPNPKSRFMDRTARLIYASRPNFLTNPSAAEEEVAFWTLLKAYGLDDMFIRYHMEVMGTPLESNRLSRELHANAELGDAALKKMIADLQKVGCQVGLYSNNRCIHGLAPEYNPGELSLDQDYMFDIQWSYSNYLNRPCAQVRNLVEFVPKLLAKYPMNGVYSDEQTNRPPWGLTDYEAGVPGAGKFSEVLYGYMLVLLKEKELYDGPVWSEGTAHHFWAGYTDMNYAQSNRPDNPVIVDYQLREIHTRQNDIGYELTAGKPSWTVDYWLASTIVFGNMGSLKPATGKHSMMQGLPKAFPEHGNLAKCYFMTRALQQLYSGQAPEVIRYADDNGTLFNTSEAVKNRAVINNMVYVKYANGLEVWVNRHDKKSWTIDFDGRKLELPPTGYAAKLDGRILEYSAGNPRCDYVASDLYHYADGRGTRTEFPELTATGAYMWRKQNDGIRLIPQEPVKPETIVLKKIDKVRKIIPMDAAGKPLQTKVDFKVSSTGLELAVDGKAFQYQLEQ